MVALTTLLGAGFALLAAVGAGIVVHELSHAAALRAFGVPYDVHWFPDRDDAGLLGAGVRGRWAVVTHPAIPRSASPSHLRAAALTPLLLATPFALVPLGIAPDPFRAGNVPLIAVTIGWLACALPSPGDFYVFWHAERVIADHPPRAEAPRKDRDGAESGSEMTADRHAGADCDPAANADRDAP